MPDYRGETSRPLDVVGLVLFGAGTALLSWLLEVFGEHRIDKRLHRADARQVGGKIFALPSESAHLADGLVSGRAARSGNVGPRLGERHRDPLSDAGVGAGDQGDFSV